MLIILTFSSGMVVRYLFLHSSTRDVDQCCAGPLLENILHQENIGCYPPFLDAPGKNFQSDMHAHIFLVGEIVAWFHQSISFWDFLLQ